MEKVSKDSKNAIGPPAIAPVRDVEHGCGMHIYTSFERQRLTAP